ncbi:hypothetical protein C2S51_036346 [Perilla frutescens var. frutescens]|nr:hypothetical protein C2S51_036346 [Perilla frutescens var. frutescens]
MRDSCGWRRFTTERSLYSLGTDLAVEFTAFENTVGHLLLICNTINHSSDECKNHTQLRAYERENVTTGVLGTLIEHASEVTVMLFGGTVRRETMHRAVFDAGCNTNAATLALSQTMVDADSRGQMSRYRTNAKECHHQHHHPHKCYNASPGHG